MLLLSGCTYRVIDLTVLSTKNVDLNKGTLVKGNRVKGSDLIPVLVIPFGSSDLQSAIDSAIETNPCAVGLSDVVIYKSNYVFSRGYRVAGNLIIDKGLNGCNFEKKSNEAKSEPVNKHSETQDDWY